MGGEIKEGTVNALDVDNGWGSAHPKKADSSNFHISAIFRGKMLREIQKTHKDGKKGKMVPIGLLRKIIEVAIARELRRGFAREPL